MIGTDLKIFYSPTSTTTGPTTTSTEATTELVTTTHPEKTTQLTNLDVWHGEEDIATFDVTTACLRPNCGNCQVSNLFDDSIYSFYFSDYDDECRKDPNKHLKTTFEVL